MIIGTNSRDLTTGLLIRLMSCLLVAMSLVFSSTVKAELLSSSHWQPDILDGFEDKTFTFSDDYDGPVTAHLIRKLAEQPSKKAVLYVHGFVDYFFQEELAERFNQQGFNFYAIDLRKHGRSLMAHQHPNFMFSVTEFYEDLDAAIDVIRNEDGNEKVLLNAHSTGGLITALYVQDNKENSPVDAIIYNGPFFDINDAFINISSRYLIPSVLKTIANAKPFGATGMSVPVQYGQSLHVTERGEWNYDLNLKPVHSFPIYWGWLKGIIEAQQRLQKGLELPVPVMVMYSSGSSTPLFSFWNDKFFETDVVLDVSDIDRLSDVLGSHVTEIKIDGAVHDVFLSKEAVRNQAYHLMLQWANAYVQ